MQPFKEVGEKIIVDCYAVELYLPADYMGSAYRGESYYSLLGTKVRFYGVGNFRFFDNEKQMENPDPVPCYPFGIPMLITTEPADIDVRDVRFKPNGRVRKCIVLTFMKGDAFLMNTEVIKTSAPVMITLSRLEQGKLDHVPPEVALGIFRDCERMNGMNFRIPSEETEVFVCERYRDPDKPGRQYRYHTGAADPDNVISYNMRTDAIERNTFMSVMHEDISTSLIASCNRTAAGQFDEPGTFEKLIRGIPMDDMVERDRNQFISPTMKPDTADMIAEADIPATPETEESVEETV